LKEGTSKKGETSNRRSGCCQPFRDPRSQPLCPFPLLHRHCQHARGPSPLPLSLSRLLSHPLGHLCCGHRRSICHPPPHLRHRLHTLPPHRLCHCIPCRRGREPRTRGQGTEGRRCRRRCHGYASQCQRLHCRCCLCASAARPVGAAGGVEGIRTRLKWNGFGSTTTTSGCWKRACCVVGKENGGRGLCPVHSPLRRLPSASEEARPHSQPPPCLLLLPI